MTKAGLHRLFAVLLAMLLAVETLPLGTRAADAQVTIAVDSVSTPRSLSSTV